MVTLAVAPVCVPRCGGLLRVQRLDGDKRLVQERPHRREKVGVSAGHGGELDGAPGRYHGAAGFADPVAKRGGGLDVIAGEMSVTGDRLDLGVAKELPDHRQPLAECQGARGEAVTEIVDAHVVEACARPDAPPRMLQVGEVGARLAALDHPEVVRIAGQRRPAASRPRASGGAASARRFGPCGPCALSAAPAPRPPGVAGVPAQDRCACEPIPGKGHYA